jgi:NitT/TauT family transport system ATP-binding protein
MKISNLCKSYGDNVVYKDFNLEIEDGKITCILGRSGSGKTTLLNVVATLTDFEGEVTKVTPSYIFQTPRLVPNLTVEGNLKLVCKEEDKIAEMLEKTGLKDKANEYPAHLSGGQAQRVALCRAFLFKSDMILMDEPFASLDLKLKISIMDMFKALQAENKISAMFVTHDVDEAVYLADRILVLDGGKIIYDCKNRQSNLSFGQNFQIRQNIINAILQ